MLVEVWSDIMCPFCYIGKRHYEEALRQFPEKDSIELNWKSFQLDPDIPEEIVNRVSVYQYLSERKGISLQDSKKMHERIVDMARNAGLEYNMEKAIVANSFRAHRVIQFAKMKGLGDKAEEVFFKAYFIDGKDLGSRTELPVLGKEIGLNSEEINEALQNDIYAYEVNQDIQEAASIGVTGVPFFVFDRKYAISGAQPVEIFLDTLKKSFAEWKKSHSVSNLEISSGSSCSRDGECD
ncbi:MAG: DsbA family oxidoreductase [Bacteroidetes bacterium]|nr:DsbA family oxidoreductase [Bacteroidota bacterium]